MWYSDFVTDAERLRFMIANNGDEAKAEAALEAYIEFRQKLQLPTSNLKKEREKMDSTEKIPDNIETRSHSSATSSASSSTGDRGTGDKRYDKGSSSLRDRKLRKERLDNDLVLSKLPMHPTIGVDLPDYYCLLKDENGNDLRCPAGKRCFLFFGAMLNLNLGTCTDYAEAVCRFQDPFMDRDSTEQFSIFVDTRAGSTWYNPYVWSMVPMANEICTTLAKYYPERLYAVYIFPCPWVCRAFWNLCKPFLAEKTLSKTVIVDGEGIGPHDPAPTHFAEPYIIQAIEKCKAERLHE